MCVDGLQRITAIRSFINNELRAFGQYYSEFGGHVDRLDHCMQVNVNNLQTRREVLQWYIEMNSGGMPHSQAEIDRVKALMEQDEQSQRKKESQLQDDMTMGGYVICRHCQRSG